VFIAVPTELVAGLQISDVVVLAGAVSAASISNAETTTGQKRRLSNRRIENDLLPFSQTGRRWPAFTRSLYSLFA
jgi:hypothetical protein